MPKKFAGENSKAVAAKARKDAAEEEKKQKKVKAEEDALWADEDKLVARKQQRKEDKDRRKTDQLQKKAEAKALLEAEAQTVAGGSSGSAGKGAKLTRAQITEQQERARAAAEVEKPKVKTHLDEPLVENVNRLQIEGETARSIDEAITVLTGKDDAGDRHPERRLKAAYGEFESTRLPRLKEEHPNMRLSQLKQLLHKEWLKSPENPMNQKLLAYNAKAQ